MTLRPSKQIRIIEIPLIIRLVHAFHPTCRSYMRTMYIWSHEREDDVDRTADDAVSPYLVVITEVFGGEGRDAVIYAVTYVSH